MTRPVACRVVFTGKPMGAELLSGREDYLDLRQLHYEVGGGLSIERRARLTDVDVIIDVGGLRPGLDHGYFTDIVEALSCARSVTVQGSDTSCATWLRDRLREAA